MWKLYAVLSAVFASLTAIFCKMGVKGVNSNLATGIRTIVILLLIWGIVFATHSADLIKNLTYKNYLFLIISGIATGLSWLFYFKAIQIGDLSKIAPIDKLSLVLTMILSFIIFKDPKEESVTKVETKSESLNKKSIVYAPINGKVIPLEEVKDEAFNSGSLGKGVGIMPEDGNVYAPVDGKITALFNSLHAIGLTSDDGMEVLVHIGLDTVKLNGKYFNAHVKQGDSVKKGDLLLTFDKEAIEKEGYDITTPVIITNSNDFLDVVETNETAIHANDVLLTGIR